MCGGVCNIPEDEIILHLDKPLLPFNLGRVLDRRDFRVGKTDLRYELYDSPGCGKLVHITLWYRGDMRAFFGPPESDLESKLRATLMERMKATEADMEPVVALWEKEIVPLIEEVRVINNSD